MAGSGGRTTGGREADQASVPVPPPAEPATGRLWARRHRSSARCHRLRFTSTSGRYPRWFVSDEAPLPKVTPGLLRSASSVCARRLYAEFTGELGFGSEDPVHRARVRDALLDAVRAHHETGAFPSPPPSLLPEERAVVGQASHWYETLFAGAPVVSAELPVEEPTPLPRRQVRLGGWVDLGVVDADGRRELRQLRLGTGVPADPLDDEAVRLAVLRLVQTRWVTRGTLTVSSADLVNGACSRRTLDIPGDLGSIGDWLDQQLDTVRRRIADPSPAPGRDCAQCRFVVGCPAHPVRGRMWSRKDDLVASVLSVTPTNLESWHRCPREWRNREVLGLPASDPVEGASHGLFVHDLLRLVHQTGSCHDEHHVDDVLALHGSDPRAADEVRRHAERCPPGATSVGHELDWVRASGEPPVFVATARLDAVWEHDGILDVRDYKTGAAPDYPLRDDRRARLQAWVAAAHAAQRGLRLRVRYEHLSVDATADPEPWEPDDDEIRAIEAELRDTVRAMRAEREFTGVHDPDVCGRCRYRSICPDSAARGEPSWPRAEPVAPAS